MQHFKGIITRTDSELPIIVSKHKVLWNDGIGGSAPDYLFVGENVYGNKVIGSYAKRAIGIRHLWYLQSVITKEQYTGFIRGKIPYRDILLNCSEIYLLRKDYNLQVYDIYKVNTLPSEYLPHESAFVPRQPKASMRRNNKNHIYKQVCYLKRVGCLKNVPAGYDLFKVFVK